ncbi:MAG TPA: GlsB/YeaQ/YmgE family stress response membrane protein [Gaiellaceae bacterium]
MLIAAMSTGTTIGAVIALIVIGLVIGAVGRAIHPGPDPIGLVTTIAIGVVSALVAGLLLGGRFGLLGYLIAVAIATALVALFSASRRRRLR